MGETDKDYDTMEMQNTQAPERAPVAVPPVMKGRGHGKFKITLVAMFLVLLLLVGGVVGLLLKSNLEAPEVPVDCDVGPWGEWTSCSVTCGEGTRDRTREKLADAAHNGEMCSSTRIISLKDQDTCNDQPCEIVVLRRKEVGNVANYFEKSFEEYKNGFESKGEMWIGLKKLRQLTYTGNYGLEVRLKDFDDLTY